MTSVDSVVEADPALVHSIGGEDCVNIIDAMPDGFAVVDAAGCMRLVNNRLAEMFGYQRSHLVGQRIELLVPESARATHERHRAGFHRDPRVRPMQSMQSLAGCRRDGSLFPVEVSLAPFRDDHAIATVRDVTERAASEAERDRLLANLREVCQLTGVEMWSFDESGRITLAEGADRTNLGPHADLIGRSATDDVLRDYAETIEALHRAHAGQPAEFVLRGRKQTRLIALRPASPPSAEGTCAVVGVSVDVSALEAARVTERALEEARFTLALIDERERIARDLHDRVIQRLFSIGMRLQAVMSETSEERTLVRLGTSVDEIDESIRELRSSIFALQSRDR